MWTRHHKQRRLGGILIVPAIAAAFMTYFGYHAFHGDYGLNAKWRYEARAAELREQLAGLVSRREEMEARSRLLSSGTIERDMLDEQARRALYLVRDDEVVIRLD